MPNEEVIKKKFTIHSGMNALDLVGLSDVHKGQRYHDKEPYARNLKWVNDNKEQQVLLLGDMIECAGKKSKGYTDQVMSVDDQIDKIVNDFWEIANEKRIWGILEGNHELRSRESDMGIDATRRIAKDLDIPYLGSGVVFYINIKNEDKQRGQNYTIFVQHGDSAARTITGKIGAIRRMHDIVNNADLYMQGHMHVLHHHTEEPFEIDRGYKKILTQHYVITGGYLKYWGSYAHRKGYAPSGPSGSAKIKFHTDDKKISVKL